MNALTRMPQQQGNWVFDGTNWVCSPCDNSTPGQPPFCPPPGFPPHGCPPWFSGMNSPPWYPGANAGVSFSTTAPLNPVRGHFWWDGVTLRMFDGAVWVGVGGASAGGTPPSVQPPANPTPGQQWFNGSTLFVWDGNAWVPVSATKTSIQPTAPPAPSPGDLWFDGTQLRIWDGSAWELVGPGATVGTVPTTTEVFRMNIASGTVGGATGGWTILPITDTPQVDTQGMWDATTKRIIPKVNGNYICHILGYFGAGLSQAEYGLAKNDSGVLNVNATQMVAISGISGAVGLYMSDSGIVHMNGTTDFLRPWYIAVGGPFYALSTNSPVINIWQLP